MIVKKNRAFLPKVAMFIFIAIVFVYTAYHLVNLFLSEEIITIVSGVTTESDAVSGTGYIFRDETVLRSGDAGAVDYFVGDGEKISKNQQIANIYGVSSSSAGILAKRMLFLTDRRIELLEKSNIGGAVAEDLAAMRSEAGDTYFKILNLLAENNTSEFAAQKEKMMVTMNKMNVMTDGASGVTASLNLLKQQRDGYLVGEHSIHNAPESGYFYYTPDGFENKFSLTALEELTADGFYSLIHLYEKAEVKIPEDVYGKLAQTTRWYFVTALSKNKAAKLEDENDYKLTFKENNNTTLTMTLQRRIEVASKDESILIFECNRLPENFSLQRCQSATIELSSVDGIYVPLSAMAKENGVRGVYVLRGSVVHFRKVDIIYNGSDYCLVAENGEDDENYAYLGTNELIITNGKNLFDGRILG